jgi:hypothetical protein
MLCPVVYLKNVVPLDSEICVTEIGFSKITEFFTFSMSLQQPLEPFSHHEDKGSKFLQTLKTFKHHMVQKPKARPSVQYTLKKGIHYGYNLAAYFHIYTPKYYNGSMPIKNKNSVLISGFTVNSW